MLRAVCAALAALCLSACGTFHKPLAPESRAKIRDVDVRVVVPQETFMFTAQAPGVSAALGGGLIPALIDSGVQQSRQKEMHAEIEAVVGPLLPYDYRAEAKAALSAGADKNFPLKLASIEVAPAMATRAQHEARIAATRTGPAYMLLMLQYAIEPGLGAFTTRTTAVLWQDGTAEPTYRSSAIFQVPLEGGQRAAVISRLTAQDGQVLRTLMRDSITETLRMVSLDLASKTVPPADSKPQTYTLNLRGAPAQVKGVSVDERSAYVLVRDDAGALYSLRKQTQ